MKVLKTIEYGLPELSASTGATDGGRFSFNVTYDPETLFTNFPIRVPETGGRTFKSVWLEWTVRTDASAAADRVVRQQFIYPKLGTADEVMLSGNYYAMQHSGETHVYTFRQDITSYFATNFSGVETNLSLRYRGDMSAANYFHLWGWKLFVTYEYEDTENLTERIKTVRFPLSSSFWSAKLIDQTPTTIANDIPAVNTLLPESGVVVRNAYIQIQGFEAPNSNATSAYNFYLDSDSNPPCQTPDAAHARLANNNFLYTFPVVGMEGRRLGGWTDMDLNQTHTLIAKHNAAVSVQRLTAVHCLLVVTYTYNPSYTTRILNSMLLPVPWSEFEVYQNSAETARSTQATFLISEPGDLTLVKSGVLCGYYGITASPAFSAIRVGSDSGFTEYQQGALSQADSAHPLQFYHPITGLDANLRRGENTLSVGLYRVSNTWLTGVHLLAFINYQSDVPAAGEGRANRTVMQLSRGSFYDVEEYEGTFDWNMPAWTSIFPTADYWVNGYTHNHHVLARFMSQFQYQIDALLAADEDSLQPTVHMGLLRVRTNSENGGATTYFSQSHLYKRFPEDRTRALKISNGRGLKVTTVQSLVHMVFTSTVEMVSLHHLKFPITGRVRGYQGDGSGLTVNLHRRDNYEWVGSATTAVGGTYSFDWYSENIPLLAQVRQSSTAFGRGDQP